MNFRVIGQSQANRCHPLAKNIKTLLRQKVWLVSKKCSRANNYNCNNNKNAIQPPLWSINNETFELWSQKQAQLPTNQKMEKKKTTGRCRKTCLVRATNYGENRATKSQNKAQKQTHPQKHAKIHMKPLKTTNKWSKPKNLIGLMMDLKYRIQSGNKIGADFMKVKC